MTTDYAIIATGGKQYRVREGDTIQIEKLSGDAGDDVTFGEVLLVSVDGNVSVGAPHVGGASVAGTIASQTRGPRLTVFKYKSKTRDRTKNGHRQSLTAVTIKSINAG